MRKFLTLILASIWGYSAVAQTYNMQTGINTINTCGGTFYDNGGPNSNYTASFNGTTTFYPTTLGSKVRLTFTAFNTESCCDKIYVYNGNSVAAPAIVNNHGGAALPNGGNVIESTAADGSLTVRFSSDGSVSYAGWTATLGCSASTLPACTGPVTGMTASLSATTGGYGSVFTATGMNFSATDISLQWESSPSATGPWTDITGATGYNSPITAVTFATTTYYRLKVICNGSGDITYTNVVSYITEPVFLFANGNNTFTTCEGMFYDSGGVNGNYNSGQNGTVTFMPSTQGASVALTFTSFNLETCCDYVTVYNGNSTAAPTLVPQTNGNNLPNGGQTITSTAADGSLTVRFTSDGSGQYAGWAAAISCVQPCTGPVDNIVANLSISSGIANTPFTASGGIPPSSNITYQWQSSTSPTGPWTNIAGATSISNNLTSSATAGVTYYRLRLICQTTNSETFSSVTSFTVQPSISMQAGSNIISQCDGIFVDNGGPGNYTSNFNGVTTFMPPDPTQAVTLQFVQFQLETCCDYVSIWNGSTIQSPVLVNQVLGNNIPNGGQVITSTALDGALTFRFTSDGSSQYSGWQAIIGCVANANPLCDASIQPGVITLSNSTGGIGSTFTGSVTGNTMASGISYTWETSDSPTGPWTTVPNQISSTGTFTAPTTVGVTYYRLVSTCVNSGTVVTSNVVSFTAVPHYSLPLTGTHTITTCGTSFSDNGGANGNYSNNANATVTFFPTSPDAKVQMTFTAFASESLDRLYIYNGNSTAATLLFTTNGQNVLPNNGNMIESTAADGTLTVRFTSDGSVNYLGFLANITCSCASVDDQISVSVCSSQLPYIFNNDEYTAAGAYPYVTQLDNGCDSTMTLNLSVTQTPTAVVNAESCDIFTWDRNGELYTASGTYEYMAPNPGGCDSLYTLNLTITMSDLTVTNNGGTFTATQNNAVYQWLNCTDNYSEIPGATNRDFVPEVSGIYACRINFDNCESITHCLAIHISTSDVDLIDITNWNVYPNPSKGEFTIDANGYVDEASIEVYSTIGQLVYQGVLNGTQTTVNLVDQPSGVYVIRVSNSQTMRVVIAN